MQITGEFPQKNLRRAHKPNINISTRTYRRVIINGKEKYGLEKLLELRRGKRQLPAVFFVKASQQQFEFMLV